MAKKRVTAFAAACCILMAATACADNGEFENDLNDNYEYPEIDLDGENYKELENIEMASTMLTLSDGSEVTVKLNMISGRYYDEYYEGYLPSIYTYSKNYEGSYELLTVNKNGDIIFRTDLEELWHDMGNTYNFSHMFELESTDYNGDGCPDFSIGMPYSSSNMGFLLLTVSDDGSIRRLCDTEIQMSGSFGNFSMIFEHGSSEEGKFITGYSYNNILGEVENVTYYYNEESGLYEENGFWD